MKEPPSDNEISALFLVKIVSMKKAYHQAKKRVFLFTIICTTNGSTNYSKQGGRLKSF